MTWFLDGPAQGQTLRLRRTPYFLRVAMARGESGAPVWDALNEAGDSPKKDETLYAYRCKELRGTIHINTGGKPGGGFFAIADYEVIDPQPTDTEMRHGWSAWCDTPEHRAEFEKARAAAEPTTGKGGE